MKPFKTIALLLAGLASAGNTLAADRGTRVERRLDHRGDVIEARYDQRSAVAALHGNFARAARLDQKGDRIDRRLDRAGKRFDRGWDRRH